MFTWHRVFLGSALALAVGQVNAEIALSDALSQGTVKGDLRLRYEHVDNTAAVKPADAVTLRTRLTWTSAPWYATTALLEFDDLRALQDDYNSSRNGKTTHLLVPDPEGTEVNQAYLNYKDYGVDLKAGRQRINLDDQRFIGGVGWRQNEQTYDGVTASYGGIVGLTVIAGYLPRVNTIWGPDPGPATTKPNITGDTRYLNVAYLFGSALKLTAFDYYLDLDDFGSPLNNQSTETYGLRGTGRFGNLSYVLSYAEQKDIESNPLKVDSHYGLAELSYKFGEVVPTVGIEVLGDGDNGKLSFQTPLATKHKFQGWADLFLTTPTNGIVDYYAGVKMPLLTGKFEVAAHRFISETGGDDFGDELDVAWAYTPASVKNLEILLKVAQFDAKDLPTTYRDTFKGWVQTSYKF